MNIKSRIWLESKNKIVLGRGRVKLLQAIDSTGSISKAAKELKMSYKKAWKMVDQINERAQQIIVDKNTGGKNGGGSELTPYGKEIIFKYEALLKTCDEFLATIEGEW